MIIYNLLAETNNGAPVLETAPAQRPKMNMEELPVTIIVVPYDPAWPEMYRQEAERLLPIFGDQLLDMYHVGSTAVPGLEAKPIIDIMITVPDISKVDELNEAMIGLGYAPKGEFGIAGRRFFSKRNAEGDRTHHVHVYEPDNPEVERHLDFRDYLIAHPETAAQYVQLKQGLAERFRHERANYTNGKSDFIQAVELKAKEWRERSREWEVGSGA